MRAITRMDIQSSIRALVEKGAGASAIKRAYNSTSSMMRAAVDDDILAVSPCRNIDLPESQSNRRSGSRSTRPRASWTNCPPPPGTDASHLDEVPLLIGRVED
jgi:hypothetical protein